MASLLVVDDDEGFRSFLADALADDHTVVEARDGREAVAALARARFDLVLTDLRMPGPDGLSLLRHLRATQPDTPALLITAHATVDSAVEAMKHGAVDVLQKPVEGPAALRALVARALHGRAPASDAPTDAPLTWGAPAMVAFVEALHRVARTNATVLLTGESGTGKELAARTIHRESSRRAGPFVAVHCAALAPSVLESELFGHERGAFTGAVAQHQGRIERAKGGTLFLDEIGELDAATQVKLLRVLQERRFERVGGAVTVQADVRVVTATHRNLQARVREGLFREDLYHRVAVVPLHIPALRERRDDIAPMARHLVGALASELGVPAPALADDALARLEALPWTGNVRELRNVLERALVLTDAAVIRAHDLRPDAPETVTVSPSPGAAPTDLRALERDAIVRALDAARGNRRRAADALGIGLRTLYEKLKRYDLG